MWALLTLILMVARRHGGELDVLGEGLHLGGLVLGRDVLDVATLAPLQLLRGDERDDDEEPPDAVLPRDRVREEHEGDDEGEYLVRVKRKVGTRARVRVRVRARARVRTLRSDLTISVTVAPYILIMSSTKLTLT